jgi:hypothetical protein
VTHWKASVSEERVMEAQHEKRSMNLTAVRVVVSAVSPASGPSVAIVFAAVLTRWSWY